jgi:hypothetical protein
MSIIPNPNPSVVSTPEHQQEDHMRGTVISVVIGLGASALGGMLIAAVSSAPPDDQPVLSGLGIFLLVIGAPMFFIAILVELFAIRPAIAKSHDATLLLLKTLPSNPQTSGPSAIPVGDRNHST